MAHHIAELLAAVDAAPNEKLRRERQNEAVEAILRLWTHRSEYENRVNPLSELKPIIQVIRTLDRDKNPWLIQNDGTRYVYDVFRRLMICLLLRNMVSIRETSHAVSSAKKTSRFQSGDERELLEAINIWLESVAELAKGKASRLRSLKTPVEEINLDESVNTLIVEARSALNTVAEEVTHARTRRGTATGSGKAASNVMAKGAAKRSSGSGAIAKAKSGNKVATRGAAKSKGSARTPSQR